MISVVTITFNNFSELQETLSSIDGVKAIESIVINGGDCERSRQLLASYSGKVVNEKDRGISDAFNKGFKKSEGVGVAYLNSGDFLIHSGYYQWADEQLTLHPELSFVYSDIEFSDPISGKIRMKPRGESVQDMGAGMPFPHPSLVVRRSVLENLDGFSEEYRISMDFDFVTRLLKAGHRGKYYPGVSVLMDGAGISTDREKEGILECKKSLQKNQLFQGSIAFQYEARLFNYYVRKTVQKVFGDRALTYLKTLKNKLK